MDTEKYFFSLLKITKRFPGVIAVDDVNLQVKNGEVHGLVGKNGAGKSTLVSVMYGKIPNDSGEIFLKGNKIVNLTPHTAQQLGICLVSQEPLNIPYLSIAENLFLSKLSLKKSGFINWNEIKNQSKVIVKELFGTGMDINMPIKDLTIGQQQLISVGKAFFVDKADIFLLDEVTASLSQRDKKVLFELIENRKKDKNSAIIFISHILKEVFEICDEVTVLRDGKNAGCERVSDLNERKLISMIVGDEIKSGSNGNNQLINEKEKSSLDKGDVLLSVANLTRVGEFENISFDIREKEIMGIAGLRGAGRTELLKCIVGFTKPDAGEIIFDNKKMSFQSVKDSRKSQIGFLPEEREREGLFQQLSVKENISISFLHKLLDKLGFINIKKENSVIENIVKNLDIKASSINQQVQYLSGGNKQKVIIGRLLSTTPKLYILDEPTRGVDIHAKKEILATIDKELRKHSGIIITTPELEDLLTICDRILVLYEGKLVGEFKKGSFNEAQIYRVMQGFTEKNQQTDPE